MLERAAAPLAQMRTLNDLVTGMEPVPTAGEVGELVRARVPAAQIDIAPDPERQALLDPAVRPIAERKARADWGWQAAYGLDAMQVDGNDVLAVVIAVKEAVEKARSGGGPSLIEAVTYRVWMHTTADDPKKYRSEDEVKAWEAKDPEPASALRHVFAEAGDPDGGVP